MTSKFDEVVLANGYKINQCDKCVYSKFNNGECVIICLYVDDMLIVGTYLEQAEDTKKFLLKNIIVGIRIMRDNNSLTLSQSHYIEKIVMKYVSNKDKLIAQNEYVRVIGCLMYAMNSNKIDHTSTTGWIFTISGVAISWGSKKQSCQAYSTVATEFIVLASATQEVE
ncbi:Reverse transcriptase [Theobroma cacao]|nr:Reverse transcriptase [Theobroma cacao]